MASPMIDGRVEPHRKATYTLDISEQIRKEDGSENRFSSVKCMHTVVLPSSLHSLSSIMSWLCLLSRTSAHCERHSSNTVN